MSPIPPGYNQGKAKQIILVFPNSDIGFKFLGVTPLKPLFLIVLANSWSFGDVAWPLSEIILPYSSNTLSSKLFQNLWGNACVSEGPLKKMYWENSKKKWQKA